MVVGHGQAFGVPPLSEVPPSVAVSEVLATPIIVSGEVSFFESLFPGIYSVFVSDLFFSLSRQVRLSLNKVHLHFWQAPASTTRGTPSHPQ